MADHTNPLSPPPAYTPPPPPKKPGLFRRFMGVMAGEGVPEGTVPEEPIGQTWWNENVSPFLHKTIGPSAREAYEQYKQSEADRLYGQGPRPPLRSEQATQGIGNTVTGTVDALKSPIGIASLAGLAAGYGIGLPVLVEMANMGVTLEGIRTALQASPEAVQKFRAGDTEGGWESLTQAAMGAGMAVAGAKAPEARAGVSPEGWKVPGGSEAGTLDVRYLRHLGPGYKEPPIAEAGKAGAEAYRQRYRGNTEITAEEGVPLRKPPSHAEDFDVFIRIEDTPTSIAEARNALWDATQRGVDPRRIKIIDDRIGEAKGQMSLEQFKKEFMEPPGVAQATPPPSYKNRLISEYERRVGPKPQLLAGGASPLPRTRSGRISTVSSKEVSATPLKEAATPPVTPSVEPKITTYPEPLETAVRRGGASKPEVRIPPVEPSVLERLLETMVKQNEMLARRLEMIESGQLPPRAAAEPTPAAPPTAAPTEAAGSIEDIAAQVMANPKTQAKVAAQLAKPEKGGKTMTPKQQERLAENKALANPIKSAEEATALEDSIKARMTQVKELQTAGKVEEAGQLLNEMQQDFLRMEAYKKQGIAGAGTLEEMIAHVKKSREPGSNVPPQRVVFQPTGKGKSFEGYVINHVGDETSRWFEVMPADFGGDVIDVKFDNMTPVKASAEATEIGGRSYVKQQATKVTRTTRPPNERGTLPSGDQATLVGEEEASLADMLPRIEELKALRNRGGDAGAQADAALKNIKKQMEEKDSITVLKVILDKEAAGRARHLVRRPPNIGAQEERMAAGKEVVGSAPSGRSWSKEGRLVELYDDLKELARSKDPDIKAAAKKKLADVEATIGKIGKQAEYVMETVLPEDWTPNARNLEPTETQASKIPSAEQAKLRETMAGAVKEGKTPAQPAKTIEEPSISGEAIEKMKFGPSRRTTPILTTQDAADAYLRRLKSDHEGSVKLVSVLKKQGKSTAAATEDVKWLTQEIRRVADLRKTLPKGGKPEKAVGGQKQYTEMAARKTATEHAKEGKTRPEAVASKEIASKIIRMKALEERLKTLKPEAKGYDTIKAKADALRKELAPYLPKPLTPPPGGTK